MHLRHMHTQRRQRRQAGAPLFLLNRFFSSCSALVSFFFTSRSFAIPLSSRSRAFSSSSLSFELESSCSCSVTGLLALLMNEPFGCIGMPLFDIAPDCIMPLGIMPFMPGDIMPFMPPMPFMDPMPFMPPIPFMPPMPFMPPIPIMPCGIMPLGICWPMPCCPMPCIMLPFMPGCIMPGCTCDTPARTAADTSSPLLLLLPRKSASAAQRPHSH